MNTLSRQLKYMYSLERFGIKPGLDVIKRLLKELGIPEEEFQSVHISGTNGKGSTAAMIESVLRQAEYKTGLYTSPHLIRFNERIQVSGQEISNERLGELIEVVKKATEKTGLSPTFFEFTTAIAFLYLAQEKIDIGVIEVGLGGEKDATNVITPLISIITNIGHDHVNIIGPTKLEIAREKAGIIKPGSIFVTAETNPKIIEVFTTRTEKIWQVQDLISAETIQQTLDHQIIKTSGMYNAQFELPLLGEHQVTNALTALVALKALGGKGFPVPLEQIQTGLQKTHWPGRLQVLSQKPLILIDGAHNEEGAQALHSFLSQKIRPSYHRSVYGDIPRFKVLLLAMKKDKDMPTMLGKIVPMFGKVIITQGNYEPMPVGELAELMQKYHANVEAISDVKTALAKAQKNLKPKDMLLITGSLYMIGDALAALSLRDRLMAGRQTLNLQI